MSSIIKNGTYTLNGLTLMEHNEYMVLKQELQYKREELDFARRLVILEHREPRILDKLEADHTKIIERIKPYEIKMQMR